MVKSTLKDKKIKINPETIDLLGNYMELYIKGIDIAIFNFRNRSTVSK